MTRFGPILSADTLEDDLTKFLKRWIATYLGEIAERQGKSRTSYPSPKYWTTTPILTTDTVSQVRYPAALVVSPGLTSKPLRLGDGRYQATYQIGVCIIASTRSEEGSSRVARRYGAAVHTAIMQRPGLEVDYIEGVEWADERFTDFLNANQDTVASATEIFNITCKGVMSAFDGPGPDFPDPLPEPATSPGDTYPELPTVKDPSDPDDPYVPVPSVEPL